jgi:hypothetical protein
VVLTGHEHGYESLRSDVRRRISRYVRGLRLLVLVTDTTCAHTRTIRFRTPRRFGDDMWGTLDLDLRPSSYDSLPVLGANVLRIQVSLLA